MAVGYVPHRRQQRLGYAGRVVELMKDDTPKRGELVSVGDIPIDVPGVGRTLTAKRQAHHFTRLDQVTQLVAARDVDPETGFFARLMALCSMPRTNPGERLQYTRLNGPYTLVMFASEKTKLPYGNLPRLLLAWVSTEAVRTQSRELVLGDSLSAFMRSVGVYDDGGAVRRRLQEQMRRLFNAHVQLVYKDGHNERFVNAVIADEAEFWWDVKRPDDRTLWQSKIELSEKFFQE